MTVSTPPQQPTTAQRYFTQGGVALITPNLCLRENLDRNVLTLHCIDLIIVDFS